MISLFIHISHYHYLSWTLSRISPSQNQISCIIPTKTSAKFPTMLKLRLKDHLFINCFREKRTILFRGQRPPKLFETRWRPAKQKITEVLSVQIGIMTMKIPKYKHENLIFLVHPCNLCYTRKTHWNHHNFSILNDQPSPQHF